MQRFAALQHPGIIFSCTKISIKHSSNTRHPRCYLNGVCLSPKFDRNASASLVPVISNTAKAKLSNRSFQPSFCCLSPLRTLKRSRRPLTPFPRLSLAAEVSHPLYLADPEKKPDVTAHKIRSKDPGTISRHSCALVVQTLLSIFFFDSR